MNELETTIRGRFGRDDADLIVSALNLARHELGHALRPDGQPYFQWAVRLAELHLDEGHGANIATVSILASTIEDIATQAVEIEQDFGARIANEVMAFLNLQSLLYFLVSRGSGSQEICKSLFLMAARRPALFSLCAHAVARAETLAFQRTEEKRLRVAWSLNSVMAPLCELIGCKAWADAIRQKTSELVKNTDDAYRIDNIDIVNLINKSSSPEDFLLDLEPEIIIEKENSNNIYKFVLSKDKDMAPEGGGEQDTESEKPRYNLSAFFENAPSPGYRRPSDTRSAEIAAAPDYKKYSTQAETKFRCEPALMEIIKSEAQRRGIKVNAFLRAAALSELASVTLNENDRSASAGRASDRKATP